MRRLLELFTNPENNRLSHTRLWANVASLVATVQFIRLNTSDWQLWLVYLGSVGGYAVVRKFLAGREGVDNKMPTNTTANTTADTMTNAIISPTENTKDTQ